MATQPHHSGHNITLVERLHQIALFAISEGYADISVSQLRTMQKLNSRQGRALAHVYRYVQTNGNGMPMSLLAKALHMSPSAASHMVNTLEKSCHLIRKQDNRDHRSVLVEVHPDCLPYAEHMEDGIKKALDYMKAPLTKEELAMFARCVEIMYKRATETEEP